MKACERLCKAYPQEKMLLCSLHFLRPFAAVHLAQNSVQGKLPGFLVDFVLGQCHGNCLGSCKDYDEW